jgi:hypothetical protein
MERIERIDAAKLKPTLTVTEAADLAGWSRTKTYRLARVGLLPGYVKRPGFHGMVITAAFLAALEAGTWPEMVA